MAIKIILTGASGMVGEGVLLECLRNNKVSDILVVGRKPCGAVHPKLKEVIVKDFFNLASIEKELAGYDSCLFCLGTSSVGISAEDYYKTTYLLTMHFATTLSSLNKGMVFCYISGAGTDATEKGRSRWARVKGKTENDLLKLPFKAVYNFRPGLLKPDKQQKNIRGFYKIITALYPLVKSIAPNFATTLSELGRAMINASENGYGKNTIEVKDFYVLIEQKAL